MRVEHLIVPIYKNALTLMDSNRPEEVKELIPTFEEPYIYGFCITDSPDDGTFSLGIILNTERMDLGTLLKVINHESIHAANRILYNAGIPVSSKDDEALAYLSEWVFEQCLNFYVKTLKYKGIALYDPRAEN